MATDFRKKIIFLFQNSFFALFLFHGLIADVWGQAVVTLNSGGGAIAGDGIKTLIGANGQIQIYRLNTFQNYVQGAGFANPVNFASSSTDSNQALYNGIFLSIANDESNDSHTFFGPTIPNLMIASANNSWGAIQKFSGQSSSGGSVASGTATTTYFADTTDFATNTIPVCRYQVTVSWQYTKPRDYVTATYTVTNSDLVANGCADNDGGKTIRLYHLIYTKYQKQLSDPNQAFPFSVPNNSGLNATIIGGSSNSTQIVEAFRKSGEPGTTWVPWESYITGNSARLLDGSQAGPGTNPPSCYSTSGANDSSSCNGIAESSGVVDHAMGVSWSQFIELDGTIPTFVVSQDILFADSLSTTSKTVSNINGVAQSCNSTATCPTVGSNQNIQYLLTVDHLAVPTNQAGGSQLNVTLTETVPANTIYAGPLNEGWSCAVGSVAGTTCTQTLNFPDCTGVNYGTALCTTGNGVIQKPTFTVTTANPIPNRVTTIDNTVTTTGDCLNQDPNNCKASVPVGSGTPSLSISKQSPVRGIAPGSSGNIVLTLTNTGTASYPVGTVLVVGEQLPGGLSYSNSNPATISGGHTLSCPASFDAGTSPIPSCTVTLTSALGTGAGNALSLTLPVTAASTGVTDTTNYASGTACGSNPCPSPPSPPDCKVSPLASTCTSSEMPNLSIAKAGPAGGFTVGTQGSYSITLTNNGTASYPVGTVLVVGDQLPSGFSYSGGVTVSGGHTVSCPGSFDSGTSPVPSCTVTLTSALGTGAGNALVLTLPVTPTTQVSNSTNYASVTACSSSPCPSPPSSPDCTVSPMPANCTNSSSPSTSLARLTLTKANPDSSSSGGFVVGQPGAFLLTVKNDGNSTYAAGSTMTVGEFLPAAFIYNSAVVNTGLSAVLCESSGASLAAAGWPLNCALTLSSDLLPGQSVSFSLNVTPTVPISNGVNTAGVCAGTGCLPPIQQDCANTPTLPGCGQSPPITLVTLPLVVAKTVNRKSAEIGDTLLYTVTLQNNNTQAVADVTLVDLLPAGFRYIPSTAQLNQVPVADPQGSPGPRLSFVVGPIAAKSTSNYSYRVRVGVGSQQGDGMNQVQAWVANKPSSNIARTKVEMNDSVFTTDACVIGKVFVDCNKNGIQDVGELGIPGVRLYMDDGTYFITDESGKFSFCGISPRTHVIKVDRTTMPKGSVLGITSNRNADDPNSLFLDVKYGELIRADFAESSCTPAILAQVRERAGIRAVVESKQEAPMQSVAAKVAQPAAVVEEFSLSADALFDFDQSTLKPQGREDLSHFAEQLRGHIFDLIVITGHTDWIGTEEYNQALSLRRAKAVQAYLLTQGVDAKHMLVEGKGEIQPIADNTTAEGRAKNRRVVVELVAQHTELHRQ